MKKVIFAIALMTFVGTVASTAYAAANNTSIEKKDDKKKKSKKKGACCSATTGTSSCAKPGTSTEGAKACCQGKK
ncbi:MAG: hypothetical protein V4638_05165 [Bacteroidota bacterium]